MIKTSLYSNRPVDGEHVLEEGVTYEINGVIASDNAIRFSIGSSLKGSLAQDVFVYTGTGAALRADAVESNIVCHFVSIMAPTGGAFEFNGNGDHQLMMFFCGFIDCKRWGTITNFDVASIKSCFFSSSTDEFVIEQGVVFDDFFNKILIDGCAFSRFNATSHAVEFLENLSVDIIDIVGNYFKFVSEFEAFKVDATATINLAGIFRGNAFSGVSSVSGFGPETIEWDFQLNKDVKDSQVIGLIHLTSLDETVISQVDTPVKVSGVTVPEMNERLTTSNNRLTYTGIRPAMVSVDASFTVDAVGNNKQLSVYIAKNGIVRQSSRSMVRVATGGDNRSGTCLDLMPIEVSGDYIEVWVENNTDTANVNLLDMTLRVIGG